MRHLLSLMLVVITASLVMAAEIRIAYEDEAEWPWTTAKQDGLDQVLAKQAGEKAGFTVTLVSLPRKRAFEQLKSGDLDAIINLSFKPERLEFLAYPLAGEKADTARRMHEDSNSVFARIGDPLAWDGKAFQGLTGAIGALPGHGSAESLKKLGLNVDDGAKTMLGQLEKVQLGRLQATVLPTDAAKLLISKNAELAKAVAPLPAPYTAKAAYLCLSKPFAAKAAGDADKLWAAIAEIRESDTFKTMAKEFMAKGE